MKAKSILTLAILLGISLSVILTAPLYARPNLGDNCLSCHTQGGVTLTLNATDGVRVNVSKAFTVQAYTEGDASGLTVIWSSVSDNPSFAFIPSSVVDNGANDIEPEVNKVRADFRITAPATKGNYTLQVFAAGSGAKAATLTLQVNAIAEDSQVSTGNLPPTAYFLASRNGMTVSFQDRCSDPEDNVTLHFWNFGDSTNSTEENPTHTFTQRGTYTVTLTITDGQGAHAAYSETFTMPSKEEMALLWDVQIFAGSMVIVFTVLFATGIAASRTRETKEA